METPNTQLQQVLTNLQSQLSGVSSIYGNIYKAIVSDPALLEDEKWGQTELSRVSRTHG